MSKDDKSTGTPPAVNLSLNSLENSRRSLGKLIRLYARNEIAEGKAKTLTYMLTALLSYFKEAKTQEIESRIVRLEELMNEKL